MSDYKTHEVKSSDKRFPGMGRLILRELDNEEKTESGLILADTFENGTQKCEILAVGKTKETWNVGDLAYIGKHGGTPIFDGLIVLEQEILWTESK